MSHRFWNSPRRAKAALLMLAVGPGALALGGCGGGTQTGSGSVGAARTLLRETFSGVHKIDSGRIQAALTIDPSGSSLITSPISLSFGGPFDSRGPKATPASNFTIAIRFDGHTGQLGIISTGTAGFVTLRGQAYSLPAASFKQLEGSVSAVGGNGSSQGSALAGVHPQNWLAHPEIVGTEEIAGVKTDHIHGTLALGPLLADISKLASQASQASSATATLGAISPAQQAKIAGEVRNASFDLWTGTNDHTIRRLTVSAGLPVNGSTRTQLGGLTAARLSFSLDYSDIGRPQTIAAPSRARPFAEFQKALKRTVLGIEELVVGASTGSSTTSAGAGTAPGGYSACVTAAGGSVAKIQKCAALLNNGG